MENIPERKIRELEQQKNQALSELRKEFKRIEEIYELTETEKQAFQVKILETVPSSEYDIKMVSRMGTNDGPSYVGSITHLIRLKKQLKSLGLNISPGGNNKSKDAIFAERLGVQTPKIHQDDVDLNSLQLIPHTVIKPTTGASSRGVYYVDGDLRLQSVSTGQVFSSKEDAVREAGRSPSRFRVEELITQEGRPARDLKIYSYYGRVALVLEIERLEGRRHYCWYDGNGKVLNPDLIMPKRRNISYFIGYGINEQLLRDQAKLALNTPCPFLRIDFLIGDKGHYLGEITPHPGRYIEGLTKAIDHEMGIEFEKAWARFIKDILDGKRFFDYARAYGIRI